MVAKLDQGGVKLCWSAGYYPKAEFHMSAEVHQVLDRFRQSRRVWVDIAVRLIYDE